MEEYRPSESLKKEIAMLKILFITFLLMVLNACTYSITLTDTHGVSSDVVDEEQTSQADIRPRITIPLTP